MIPALDHTGLLVLGMIIGFFSKTWFDNAEANYEDKDENGNE